QGRRERREREDRRRVGDRQAERRRVGPGETAPCRAARRFNVSSSFEQDAEPETQQDGSADNGQRPPPRGERSRQRGDAERRDGGVEGVSGRDSEAREQAGEPALQERAPNAQEEDRPGRRGDGQAQDEAPEQQAEHRIPSWPG